MKQYIIPIVETVILGADVIMKDLSTASVPGHMGIPRRRDEVF